MNSRIAFVDVFRVLLASLIVVLHASGIAMSAMAFGGRDWSALLFVNSVSRVAVPCFFMLSGYLLLGRDESGLIFFKKRFCAVFVPFLAWSGIYMAWNAYWGVPVVSTVQNIVNGSGASYHLWYVYSLVGLYLITPFLRKICPKTVPAGIIAAVACVAMVRPLGGLVNHCFGTGWTVFQYLSPVEGPIVYFVLGYYLPQLALETWARRLCAVLFPVGLLVMFSGTLMESRSLGQLTEMYFYQYGLTAMLCAFSLYVLFFAYGNRLIPVRKGLFELLSRGSYAAYLMHVLVINCLWTFLIKGDMLRFGMPIVTGAVYCALCVACSSLIAILLLKIPVVRQIFVEWKI